jgi:DNA-binding XRE family transcriptional regulator
MSLRAIAATTGIHRTTIGQIELGRRNCSLQYADDLARALGSTVAQLIVAVEKLGQH